MKIIAVINQKGGCGKTSLSVLMTLALAAAGRRVLAVDCDPQGGLTSFLAPPSEEVRPGLFDLIGGFNTLDEIIVPVDRSGIVFDVIPSDYRLDQIASTLNPYMLKRKFKELKGYDYMLLDNPPTVQGISIASAIIADKIYVPADISVPSLGPTLYTLASLKDIEKKGNVILIGYKEPKEESTGFISELSRKFMEKLNGYYVGTVPKTITTARAVADPELNWTRAKIEGLLNPLLEIVEEK